MTRVLHLKKVTQCAVLDEFGLFLVLADKVLLFHPIPAVFNPILLSRCSTLIILKHWFLRQLAMYMHRKFLRRSMPRMSTSSASAYFMAELSSSIWKRKEWVHFLLKLLLWWLRFMHLKNGDSVLHAVEPVIDKINEGPKPSGGLLSLRRSKTEWFRLYKEFTFPDAHDVIFLKTRIAVLGTKGFNIMDLTEWVISSNVYSYSNCRLVMRALWFLNAMMWISPTFQNVVIRVVR